ncbi:MAG: MFS transporter [Myxococcales bacterium]|nr:MFS transporter [Myxococcales bacterium]
MSEELNIRMGNKGRREIELLAAAALFALLYSALAAIGSFGPLVFSVQGLSPQSIALAASLASFMKIVVPMVVGSLADNRGRRWVLQCATGFAIVIAGGMSFVVSPGALIVGYAAYIGASAAQVPLVDVLAYEALGERKERYAWVRVWGSVGFASSLVVVGGSGLPQWPFGFFGLLVVLQVVALAVVTWGLTTPVPRVSAASARGLMLVIDGWQTARKAGLGWFLFGTMLSFCGFGIYDTYYALRLKALGFGESFIGCAMALGVGAEIILMLLAPRYLARVGSESAIWLTLIGAATASIRWLVISATNEPWILLSVQPLHAISFGLWFLGVVAHGQGRAPNTARARIQGTTNAAVGSGGLLGVSIGGWFAATWGFEYAFWLGAVTSGAAAGVYLALLCRPLGKLEC